MSSVRRAERAPDPNGRVAISSIEAPSRTFVVQLIAALVTLAAPAAGSAGILHAQSPAGVIQGRVVSAEDGGGLAAASVVVRQAADSTVVASEVSSRGGAFAVVGLRPGRYLVEVSLLGYAPATPDPVTLASAADTVSLGAVRLSIEAIALREVEVRGERAPVVMAPDRTIYSTEGMPVASGGSGTDILRGIPELDVDIDGSVGLRGGVPEIYINGRPAPMEGEALTAFLEQFPADRIERVEVIPNPSARFRADGAGGIVNIVLKEDVDLGLNGSVFANGSTRGDAGGGGRVSWQRGRFSLAGGGHLRRSRRSDSGSELRQNLLADPVTVLEQDSWSERRGLSASLDLSAELETGPGSAFWTELRAYRNASDSEGVTRTAELDAGGFVRERYDRLSAGRSERMGAEVAAGWRHRLGTEGHELNLEASWELDRDADDDRVRIDLLEATGPAPELPPELTLDDGEEDERELELEVDYVRPWGDDGRVELGYRGGLEDTDNERLLERFEDAADPGTRVPLASGFGFREVSNAVYATLTRGLGDFGAQVGARAERVSTRLDVPGAETVGNDYDSFFPSAHLSWDLGSGRSIRLSYSKRIRRPSPWVLNPIDRSTDPLNRRVGNPDIEPQHTHSVSLETSWTGDLGTLRFSPYYRKTVGDWARLTTVDDAGVSTETWENLASIQAYGTSLTASVRPSDGWRGYASLSGFREVRDASNLVFDYSGASMRWSARANVSGRLSPSLAVQAMLYYTPAREVPQGRVSARVMTHVGLRKSFWGDRASVNFTATDPLGLWDRSFTSSDPTHIRTGSSSRSPRRATLSFTWSFGSPGEGGGDRDRAGDGRRGRRGGG